MMSKLHCVSGDRPLTALLNGLVRLVYEAVIAPMRRRARRRADARELARLADHLLRDIGMTRAQVLAAAFGPVGPDRHFRADSVRARSAGPGNVVRLKRPASARGVDEAAAAPLARRAARG